MTHSCLSRLPGPPGFLASAAREAVFVYLQMAPGGAQQRGRDAETAGAAQHVADDRIRFGPSPSFEVLPHRGAVDAAALGQYRLHHSRACGRGSWPEAAATA